MNRNADETLKTLYLDCSAGISGDMTVAALLDLGADQTVLQNALDSLPLDGYHVRISRVAKSGIDACDFDVILDDPDINHDHDMEYLHGHDHPHRHAHEHVHEHPHDHEHEHDHDHPHEHEHEHPHDHEHEHDHDHPHEHDHEHPHDHSHGHHHHGRNLADITKILEAGSLTPHALELALKIFQIVAEAEAHVHGKSIEEIHFHEVGAVDSIVDIASIAICMDNLGIGDVIVTHLTEGSGTVRCQHGILPIPVPAVAQIASANRLPIHILPIRGELVTPTGAAFTAAVRTSDQLPESFIISRIGYGAGKRIYETSGLLRAMIIE